MVFQIASLSESLAAVWESADQNLIEPVRVLVADLLHHEVLLVFVAQAVVRGRALLDRLL